MGRGRNPGLPGGKRWAGSRHSTIGNGEIEENDRKWDSASRCTQSPEPLPYPESEKPTNLPVTSNETEREGRALSQNNESQEPHQHFHSQPGILPGYRDLSATHGFPYAKCVPQETGWVFPCWTATEKMLWDSHLRCRKVARTFLWVEKQVVE